MVMAAELVCHLRRRRVVTEEPVEFELGFFLKSKREACTSTQDSVVFVRI